MALACLVADIQRWLLHAGSLATDCRLSLVVAVMLLLAPYHTRMLLLLLPLLTLTKSTR